MSYNSLTHHTVWFADHIMYHHRDGGSDKEKGVAKEIYGKKKDMENGRERCYQYTYANQNPKAHLI